MEPRTVSIVVWGVASLLGLCAIETGITLSLLSAPLVLGLGVCGMRLRNGVGGRIPGALVLAGGGTSLLGLAITWLGPAAGGLATSLAGLGLVYTGGRLGLDTLSDDEREALPAPQDLALVAAVAADEGIRTGFELLFRLRRHDDLAEWGRDTRSAGERTVARGWLTEPATAHPIPPSLEKPVVERRSIRGLGFVEQLSFASEYEPPDPEVRDRYLGFARNRTAHATLLRHRDGPRPTLLCLHGFGMGRVSFDARIWDLAWLHQELGLDVILPVLPLHGPRALGRLSGAGFLGDHPLWTRAALGQAIWELRRLTGWLRQQGAPSVGVHGLSLGGLVAALYGSLEGGLACTIPLVPAASLSRLMFTQMRGEERARWETAGLGEDLLEQVWAPVAPLHHRPQVAPEGRLIVAGLADRMCPPEQARALAAHWDAPIHWFPGSHVAWLGRAGIRKSMEEVLHRTLLANPSTEDLLLSRFRIDRSQA